MDALPITLVVKSPKTKLADFEVKCESSWTVRRLKGHIAEVMPCKPEEQKLVYGGLLLQDSAVLKDVLRVHDSTIHLVRTPSPPAMDNSINRSQNSVKSHRNSTTAESSTIMGSGVGTGGPGSSSGGGAARLVFVNERTGSVSDKTTALPVKPRKIQRDLDTSLSSNVPPRLPPPSTTLLHHQNASSSSNIEKHHQHSKSNAGLSFSDRALKHHSFLSEVPDVRHMEQALLGLLDDFHSGKLRAFGSGTMDQMTDIREQQERLAKLHFELGGAVHNMMLSEEELGGVGNENESIAQENMTRVVKQLEQLSVSIEALHSDAL